MHLPQVPGSACVHPTPRHPQICVRCQTLASAVPPAGTDRNGAAVRAFLIALGFAPLGVVLALCHAFDPDCNRQRSAGYYFTGALAGSALGLLLLTGCVVQSSGGLNRAKPGPPRTSGHEEAQASVASGGTTPDGSTAGRREGRAGAAPGDPQMNATTE